MDNIHFAFGKYLLVFTMLEQWNTKYALII